MNKVNISHLNVANCNIDISPVVKNLGCYFDSQMSMSSQISSICQTSFFHLRNIGKIRSYIDEDTAKVLVSSFVMSHLDYCNSLLSELPESSISRLQKVQNQAARIVTRTKKKEHIQPVLKSLHWLPVKERIDFKILCHAFKCYNKTAPFYLQELLTSYVPARQLRSSSKNQLVIPKTNSVLSQRAFSIHAPVLWNSLPEYCKESDTIESFKRKLKTILFTRAYD